MLLSYMWGKIKEYCIVLGRQHGLMLCVDVGYKHCNNDRHA